MGDLGIGGLGISIGSHHCHHHHQHCYPHIECHYSSSSSSRCSRCSSMQPGLTMTELFLAFVSSLVHSSTSLYHWVYIDVVKGYNEHRVIQYNTLPYKSWALYRHKFLPLHSNITNTHVPDMYTHVKFMQHPITTRQHTNNKSWNCPFKIDVSRMIL